MDPASGKPYGRPNFVQVPNMTGTTDGAECSGGRAGFPGGRADMIFPGLYSGKSESPSQKIQILPQLAPITTGEDHIRGKRHAALRRRTLGLPGTP